VRRLLACLILACLPATAHALCEGRDLIDTLAAEERARIAEAAAATPYPEGLFWRATRAEADGARTEFLLFGTYHFRHVQTEAHLEALKPIIDAADALYLEMSPGEQRDLEARMSTDPSLMFLTEGPTMPDLLEEEEWQRFADAMSARGFPAFMAAKFKPVWASMMLSIGPCEAQNGAMEAKGIDQALGDYAEGQGIPTRSLEEGSDLIALLNADPMEQQLAMLRLTLDLPLDADDLSYTIRERYLAQEIALIWEYSKHISLKYGGPTAQADFDRFEEMLLTTRNAAWIERLLGEAAGERVVIAAGAGHWPGEAGVLRLLEDRGFALERLAF
jgi:uncharacterized protein YbaP (TraB family)